jgi:hypothetical protein
MFRKKIHGKNLHYSQELVAFFCCYFFQTVNDVMVGVTEAALTRNLNRKYGKKFLKINLMPTLLRCKVLAYVLQRQ